MARPKASGRSSSTLHPRRDPSCGATCCCRLAACRRRQRQECAALVAPDCAVGMCATGADSYCASRASEGRASRCSVQTQGKSQRKRRIRSDLKPARAHPRLRREGQLAGNRRREAASTVLDRSGAGCHAAAAGMPVEAPRQRCPAATLVGKAEQARRHPRPGAVGSRHAGAAMGQARRQHNWPERGRRGRPGWWGCPRTRPEGAQQPNCHLVRP